MKDDIKEILEQSLDYEFNLTFKQRKELLDCITNLQEEINKLTVESTEWESKCYDLQEEIKGLNASIILLDDNRIYLNNKIDKAVEIYENRNTCKYKKERFMEDKSTSNLMYEALTGGDE